MAANLVVAKPLLKFPRGPGPARANELHSAMYPGRAHEKPSLLFAFGIAAVAFNGNGVIAEGKIAAPDANGTYPKDLKALRAECR